MFTLRSEIKKNSTSYYYLTVGPPAIQPKNEIFNFLEHCCGHIIYLLNSFSKVYPERLSEIKNQFPNFDQEVNYLVFLNNQIYNSSAEFSTKLFFLREYFRIYFGDKDIDLYSRDLLCASISNEFVLPNLDDGLYSLHFHSELMESLKEFCEAKKINYFQNHSLKLEDVLSILLI